MPLHGPRGPDGPDSPVLAAKRAEPRRIVVIDDDPDVTDLTCELLTRMGHQALAAYDGAGGLAVVESFQPDVVLLDLALPEMSGFEVVDRLRRRPADSDRLIIAITGHAQPADLQRAREAGFDHYLVKPVRLESLRALVGDPSRDADATPVSGPTRSLPVLAAEANEAFERGDSDGFAAAVAAIVEVAPEPLAIDLLAVAELAGYDRELAAIRWSHLKKRLR
jgi:two-component system OmpR family response regulator